MYVQKNADMQKVYQVLEEYSVKNYSCLENQFVPLNLVDQSPEVRLSASFLNDSDSYLSRRNSYFFDRDKLYTVFYIPEKYSSKLPKVLSALGREGIKGGVNANANYPFICPLVIFLFAILLVFYSENKIRAVLYFSLPVYFSFFVPVYLVCSSLCLFMYASFLSFRILERKNTFEVLKKSRIFVILLSVSLVSMLFTSFKAVLLYILLLLSCAAVLYLYKNILSAFENAKYSFVPVKIRTANMIRLVTKKSRFCLLLMGIFVSFVFLFALISMKVSFPSSDDGVKLPSAVSLEKSLPDLGDFIDWRWEALIYPYVSLNSSETILPKDGNTVYFPRFTEENGKITQSLTSITFNQKFKEDSVDSLESLDYPAIEKVIRKQGRMRPGFTSAANARPSFVSVILMTICSVSSFFMYFIITNPKFRGRF